MATANTHPDPQRLIDKIHALPIERRHEVESFIDYVCARDSDRKLTGLIKAASLPTFATIWNNAEDDIYDSL